MKRPAGQGELFGIVPTTDEQAALVRRLEQAVKGAPIVGRGMSAAATRRLMTPLPRITALD